ncbi:MAG: inositol monophosphatase family protein [Bacteroidota bacterium]
MKQIDKDFCEKVKSVVGKAVRFIKAERQNFNLEAVEYKGLNDLVSYVDKNAEQLLVDELTQLIADAGFITEENTVAIADKDYCWIIDPLDGTTNFIHGLNCYCVSVGLKYKGELVLGVVHEVNSDECFYAWKDGGAFCNGNKIQVSATDKLSQSLVATGFPYTNYTRMESYMRVFDYCMRNTHGLRRLGSAAVDLVYVAAGRMDSFFEYGLNAWDVAAGCLILKEAGGEVTDFSGGDNFLFGKEILATNKKTHQEFLNIITKEFK